MAQAVSGTGGVGTQIPRLWSPGSNPAGRTNSFHVAHHPQCTEEKGAQEGLTLLPGFLLLEAVL